MSCGITSNVSGPCGKCGKPAEPAHIITDGGGIASVWIACKECCPVHGTRGGLKEWTGEPVTIEGEQEKLF